MKHSMQRQEEEGGGERKGGAGKGGDGGAGGGGAGEKGAGRNSSRIKEQELPSKGSHRYEELPTSVLYPWLTRSSPSPSVHPTDSVQSVYSLKLGT